MVHELCRWVVRILKQCCESEMIFLDPYPDPSFLLVSDRYPQDRT
jgi:hypothetical protein